MSASTCPARPRRLPPATAAACSSAVTSLLRGDKDKLAHIRSSDEFERLTARAQLITENLGIVSAFLGERLMSQMSVFSQQVEELT